MTREPTPTDSLSRVRERAGVRARALRTAPTDAERSLWQALRGRQLVGYKFRRQHPVGRYFADFACVEAGLIVELDGGQHFEPVAARADADRTAALRALGFHVLRYTDRETLTERNAVLADILHWLSSNHPHPSPLPHAGEGAGNHPDSLPPAGEGANTKEPSHG